MTVQSASCRPAPAAQARYGADTLEILQDFFDGRPIRPEYLIVDGGKLAGTGAKSYQLA